MFDKLIQQKLNLAPDSKFINSLRDHYAIEGFLTATQEATLNEILILNNLDMEN